MKPKTFIAKRLQEVIGEENSNTLCSKIKISRTQIGRMLRGDSVPSFKLLKYIAENGADLTYVLTGKKAATKGETGEILTGRSDSFLKIVLERWEFLKIKQKAIIAAEVTEATEEKNPHDRAEIG